MSADQNQMNSGWGSPALWPSDLDADGKSAQSSSPKTDEWLEQVITDLRQAIRSQLLYQKTLPQALALATVGDCQELVKEIMETVRHYMQSSTHFSTRTRQFDGVAPSSLPQPPAWDAQKPLRTLGSQELSGIILQKKNTAPLFKLEPSSKNAGSSSMKMDCRHNNERFCINCNPDRAEE